MLLSHCSTFVINVFIIFSPRWKFLQLLTGFEFHNPRRSSIETERPIASERLFTFFFFSSSQEEGDLVMTVKAEELGAQKISTQLNFSNIFGRFNFVSLSSFRATSIMKALRLCLSISNQSFLSHQTRVSFEYISSANRVKKNLRTAMETAK